MFLYAFDLIELNGDDLRRDPLEVRKATLTSVLAKARVGIRFNEHLEFDDGEAVFHHACKMGLEGIVSKRKDSTYRSGRSPDWLKMKNPACEAVRREAEGGLGSVTTPWRLGRNAFNAASHRRSGSRSPAWACSMMTLATVSRAWAVQPIGSLEGDHSALQSDAHETDGLWVESLTGQIEPYWHCGRKCIENFSPVKRDDATTRSTAG